MFLLILGVSHVSFCRPRGESTYCCCGSGMDEWVGSKGHGLHTPPGDGDCVWCGVFASLLLAAIAACYTLLGLFFHFFLW